MVKGVSRQVVLVRPHENDLFEQAIFLVRGDKIGSGEITDEMLLKQAEAAAMQAVKNRPQQPRRLLIGALLGGGLVGFLWLLVSIV